MIIQHILAASDNVVGTITNPLPPAYKTLGNASGTAGIVLFFSNILRLIFVVAGIFAFFNFIIAGFQYMNAGGDTKSLTAAWDRIWQSLLGLIIIVGSFALTAVMSQLFFGSSTFILNPVLYGPK